MKDDKEEEEEVRGRRRVKRGDRVNLMSFP